MPDSKVLSGLRDQVASLRVQSCCLSHERVVMEEGAAKRRSQGTGLEPVLIRVGLCPKAVRSQQLSCAHTLARHTFAHAIEVAEQQGILGGEEANRLREELQRIDHVIHTADWAKSEAEVRYALLREQEAAGNPATATKLEAERQLTELIERHRAAAEWLRRIHRLLLERIDSAARCG
ncbi:MAG TPA: hypothetical protein VEC01_04705 [Noviherbaspirillum sp.]|uniref:hypothetical protein n=1 Tax=Noviherbaspirillum sp. TaxID=1926288 RepID=UPI002D6D5134|nr:hypothetical protein [Noviherbaspirillum sp.]HYD94605.1 hypothetical protein [Noviherbaspirillum sp.]